MSVPRSCKGSMTVTSRNGARPNWVERLSPSDHKRTSADRGPGQLVPFHEEARRIARLVARGLPYAMAGIPGQKQKPAGAFAQIGSGRLGGEQAENLGLIAAFEIGPGAVRQVDEIRHAVGIDREPAMHIDAAAL